MRMRRVSSTTAAAVVLGMIMGDVRSELPPQSYDPTTQFCRRFYHQAAQIGNRLYMDGGYVTALNQDHNKNYTNNLLTFHDLDDSSSVGSRLHANLSKPAHVPNVAGGALWADEINEKLYLFGGEYTEPIPSNQKDPANAVWSYDPWDDKWSVIGAAGDFSRPSFGASVSVNQQGKGYYLGGWLGPQNTPGWQGPKKALNSLIVYDFVEQTAQNLTGPTGSPRVEGAMHFVPVGDRGLLVSYGGAYAEDGRELKPAPLDQIDVYDIAAAIWYRVKATGQVPGQRRRFCGDLVSAKDGSSHNIYLYGGASVTSDSPGQDDVYILTLPAFKWIMYTKNQGDSIRYHNGFTCNIVNKGQMFIVGGTYPHDIGICDVPEIAGSHYLDLGRANKESYVWWAYRNQLKTYDVPSDISKVIGGGPGGQATKTTPDGGFNTTDLRVLFNRKLQIEPRKPTRTPKPLESADPSGNSKRQVGIIVGPAVGLGLSAFVGVGIFVFLRRRKQVAQARGIAEDGAAAGGFRGTLPPHLKIPTHAYQLPTTQSPIEPRAPVYHHHPSGDTKFGSQMALPGYGCESGPNGDMYGRGSPVEMPTGMEMEMEPQEMPADDGPWSPKNTPVARSSGAWSPITLVPRARTSGGWVPPPPSDPRTATAESEDDLAAANRLKRRQKELPVPPIVDSGGVF